MKYKCIIFDCDGVLVDSEEISNRVLVDKANALGANIDYDYAIKNLTGVSLNNILKHFEELIGSPLPADFEADFRKRTFELFKTDLKPISGIREVLEQINIPVGVASSGPKEKIKLNLTTTRLIDKFNGNIFSCYDIQKWKPDPAIFLHAAQTMGFKPADCLVIEDSISGVQAARNGGFHVLGYAHEHNKDSFLKEDVPVFYAMNELIDLIR